MMKSVIVYGTKTGVTEDIAVRISEQLKNPTDLINVREMKRGMLDSYDLIIIGTPIYITRPIKSIRKFAKKENNLLETKKIAFFTCGADKERNPREYLEKAFSSKLLNQAISIQYLGGEFRFDRMNFINKAIMKKVAETENLEAHIFEERIIEFAAFLEQSNV